MSDHNQKKTGVLLIQLGTPDSPSVLDVGRYLSEFLGDPRVVDIPWLFRKLLVNGIIVPFRSPRSARIYKTLWNMSGGVSPLLTHTRNTCTQLQNRFPGENVHIEMAMRYQNPSLSGVLERMRLAAYDRIVIIPLFPQYASASTGSAMARVMEIISGWWVIPEIRIINQFHDHPAYIEAVADRAASFRLADYDHILFSYHGLPERHLDKVYPDDLCENQPCETELNASNRFCYKATCYDTSRRLAQQLGLDESRYTVCFQSRMNNKWVQPFADRVIAEQAARGAKKLLVFSPAFVADCLETLVEIGEEYQADFTALGGEKVQLVPSVNDHARFIDCLESLVREG